MGKALITMKRSLALFGCCLALFFLVGVLPASIVDGEFQKDIELAFPGALFWLMILMFSLRTIRRANSQKQKALPFDQGGGKDVKSGYSK